MSKGESVEHATAARKVPGSSLGHSLLFDQNPGIFESCVVIGEKSEACDITIPCLWKCNREKSELRKAGKTNSITLRKFVTALATNNGKLSKTCENFGNRDKIPPSKKLNFAGMFEKQFRDFC